MVIVGTLETEIDWTYRLCQVPEIRLTDNSHFMNNYSDRNSENWNCKVKCVNYVILNENCVIYFSGIANNFMRLEFSPF